MLQNAWVHEPFEFFSVAAERKEVMKALSGLLVEGREGLTAKRLEYPHKGVGEPPHRGRRSTLLCFLFHLLRRPQRDPGQASGFDAFLLL